MMSEMKIRPRLRKVCVSCMTPGGHSTQIKVKIVTTASPAPNRIRPSKIVDNKPASYVWITTKKGHHHPTDESVRSSGDGGRLFLQVQAVSPCRSIAVNGSRRGIGGVRVYDTFEFAEANRLGAEVKGSLGQRHDLIGVVSRTFLIAAQAKVFLATLDNQAWLPATLTCRIFHPRSLFLKKQEAVISPSEPCLAGCEITASYSCRCRPLRPIGECIS